MKSTVRSNKPQLFERLAGGAVTFSLVAGLCCSVFVALAPMSAEAQQAGTNVGSTGASIEMTATPIETLLGNEQVWRKLVPYLPQPGRFAVVPGSALRPVLVRDGEFSFCAEIQCHRSASVLGAWNGGAFDPVRGVFRVHGGGHADYGGNEVYVFDFSTLQWKRETEPQPLTGPFLVDTDHDGVADACPAPAAGPPATHTYQGFIYVPRIDRYWLFGTGEYCLAGMGGSAAWEYDVKSRTWSAMPELDKFAMHARALIDPASGNILVHGGRRQGWYEIDPTVRRVIRSFEKDPFGSYGVGPALFDPVHRVIYAIFGGGKKNRLVAYDWPAPGKSEGFQGRLIAEWPKGGRKAWGMAQHASGLLVLWDGNTRIVIVDPDSGKSWEEATGGLQNGSTEAAEKPRKVYSKWSYIREVDAFFGISNADLGVVLYRIGRSAADARRRASNSVINDSTSNPGHLEIAPRDQYRGPLHSAVATTVASDRLGTMPQDNGRAAPLEITADASWKEVCATAILCDPMGEGEVLYRGRVVASGPPKRERGWRNIQHKFMHPEAEAPTLDPEVGGLRFTFPSHSRSGAAGNFKTNFSPDYSFQVGSADAGAPAQEVYIQFQVRYSCTFIWRDCDPLSPQYRKERRCFLSTGSEGGCTASKIALISTGDREGFHADACTNIQTAINHTVDHALTAFHRCPTAIGFGEGLPLVNGRTQRDSQPNGVYHCPLMLDNGRKRSWNSSSDSCFRLIDEKWITIQIHLRFGPWQGKRKKNEPQLSHVSIWAAIEEESGGRQKLVIDNDFAAGRPQVTKDFVGKIWLMPHLYKKSDAEDHPPFNVWYRNLVVSQSIIPNQR